MKYLLQAIEAKRDSVKLDDGQLRRLLTEVCKGRDEREEFLESIDRIVTELKNYTEHSAAFLSKVSKRDAPDYYDVIKHPMDLASIHKKLKAGQYKNKKQFSQDLNLIWDNCLLYNSDPAHPLRRNVQFMRKKADHLLEFITDRSKDTLVHWTSQVAEPEATEPEPLQPPASQPSQPPPESGIFDQPLPPIQLPALPSSSQTVAKRSRPYSSVPATRRKGLRGKIARNIRTIHRLQHTHNKFVSLAHYVDNEAPIPISLTSVSSDEESDYPSDAESSHSAQSHTFCSPLARITPEMVRQHTDYTAQTLLAHQGFEGSQRVASDVLADLLAQFLGSMGRVMRAYTDRYGSKMSAEELMLHTLQESGGLDVLGLENYVRNDVERYGVRMAELLRKLRQSYREHFAISTERAAIDDALLADGSLVAGNFAEELGDDYFGFRELGLDRELGLAGLTVPARLFYGRSRNAPAAQKAKESAVAYEPPPPPIAVTVASISVQIGLMQAFYEEQFRAAPPGTTALEEQEQERPRYKVPPSGKMPRRL